MNAIMKSMLSKPLLGKFFFSDIKLKSTSSESTKRIIAQVFGVYPDEVLQMLLPTDATAQ